MTDEELIEQYKAKGGTVKVYTIAKDEVSPYTGTIEPVTEQPIQYDNYNKRIYTNLNKTLLFTSPDTNTLNYGE